MYSGELEVQAKRKTIAILPEGTNKILNLSRELAIMTYTLLQNNMDGIRESSDKMSVIENDIMVLRNQIAREVMTHREDLLRTAYFIDEFLVISVGSLSDCPISKQESLSKISIFS